jgi:hypothetical protein
LRILIGEGKKPPFGGELLDNRYEDMNFLMATIQGKIGKVIRTTKLLYDFQRDHKINFNNRIDGHSHLTLVVKTQNALISCYYSGIYEHKTPLEGRALIISLDNKKVYAVKSLTSEGMIYDYDYLIFGNDEVKIKAKEDKITSTFGNGKGYFDTKMDTVNALLREGNAHEA